MEENYKSFLIRPPLVRPRLEWWYRRQQTGDQKLILIVVLFFSLVSMPIYRYHIDIDRHISNKNLNLIQILIIYPIILLKSKYKWIWNKFKFCHLSYHWKTYPNVTVILTWPVFQLHPPLHPWLYTEKGLCAVLWNRDSMSVNLISFATKQVLWEPLKLLRAWI